MKLFPFCFLVSCAFVCFPQASHAQGGPWPVEFSAWTEIDKQAQRKAGEQMIGELFSAIQAGKKEICIPQAHYRFASNSGGRYPAHIIFPR